MNNPMHNPDCGKCLHGICDGNHEDRIFCLKTQAQLVQALMNIRFDLSCGYCAALFYTGSGAPFDHSSGCFTSARGNHLAWYE